MTSRNKSKTEIEAEIRQHVVAEERAYRWVEHLAMTESISQEEIKIMVNEITMLHYRDIAEERAVSKWCGYPLCNNKLLKFNKQKYCISTSSNKVYDLTERKCFCSSFCFKASKFVEEQIPQSPLWLRSLSDSEKVQILSTEMKAPSNIYDSHEVSFGIGKLNLDNIEKECKDADAVDNDWNEVESRKVFVVEKEDQVVPRKTLLTETPPKKVEEIDVVEELKKLYVILTAWCNANTYTFLKQCREDNDDENFETKRKRDSKRQFQEEAIIFLSKNPEWAKESQTSNKTMDNEKQKNMLPPIDAQAQHTIRRRIVKGKIQLVLNKLSQVLHLTNSQISDSGFYAFVNTFRFTNRNIVLKAKQWVLMTLLLLRIYSYAADKFIVEFSNHVDNVSKFLLRESMREYVPIDETSRLFIKEFLFHDESDEELNTEEINNAIKSNEEEGDNG